MPVRLLPFVALLTLAGLVAEPAPLARAEQQASSGPPVVIRFRSLESLIVDAKWLANLAGKDEEAAQVEGLVRTLLDPKAIDVKKPFALYAHIAPRGEAPSPVAMVPVADQKAFLRLLDQHNVAVKEDKTDAGLYTFEEGTGRLAGHLRFANGYAYFTNAGKGSLDKSQLAAPAQVFDPADKAAASAVLRIARIPQGLKDLFLEKLKDGVELAKQKKLPDETPAQERLKGDMFETFYQHVKSLLSDGNELAFRLDIDSKKGEVSVDFSLNAQPKTKLAATLAGLEMKSLFAGAIGSDSAINLAINSAFPDNLKAALGPVIDEGIDKAIRQEKKVENKAMAKQFLDVLTPTLKAGEVDLAVSMRGPKNDKYALLAGLKIRDGLKVDQALRDVVKQLKPEEQARIKFDAIKVGGVNVHELTVTKDLDRKAKALFGEGPLYVGFRKDAIFFAFGADAVEVLKGAVAAKPGTAPPFRIELSLSRLAKLVALDNPALAQAAEKALAKAKGDRLRVVVEGGPSLRARFSMQEDVLRFIAEAGKLQAGAAEKQGDN